MARVFISHSSLDNKHAAEIKTHLSNEGVDTVFLDIDEHSGIQPGADWERKLYQEIDSAHAVVLVLTPSWLESKWCFVEFAQARALGKAIFPVIVAPGGEKFFAPDIQHLDLRTDRQGGLARLSRAVGELALDTQGGFAWDRERPPYPGLLSFEAEDAAIFFGRDDDIRRLIERLNARRVQGGAKLLVVLGASGSGKSSLIRAGVLPRLARDKRNWIVLPPFRPRLDPTVELARAATERLGNLDEWKSWRERLASEGAERELEAIAETFRVKAGARDATILITVDQAEELLAVTPEEKAREFWKLLATATAEDSPFLILMTLRSDYLGLLQKAAEGVTRFEEFSLGPMPLNRVRQIIEGPARVAGLRVEEGLVLAAAADAGSDDALPLLAFTLRELYDRYGARREGGGGERQLLLAHYRELGDPAADLTPLENSVRKRADDVIAGIDPKPEELDALRAAFVGPLVRVNDKGEYVRHPARLSDLPDKAHAILGKLTDARLLVTRDEGGQQTIEVAHEALLRKWPRLRAWLDEEREFLIGKSRLEDALGDWEKASDADKPSALLQGLALSRASQWLVDHPHAISDAERAFIEQSEARARAEQRRRIRNRIALAASALLLLAGAGIVFMQVQSARRESEALQRGVDATRLAFQSGVFLGANDVPNAVRTAVKAEETLSTAETRSALLQSLLALSPHLAASLTVRDFQPLLLAGAGDSQDVLIGAQGGSVEVWDPAKRQASRSVASFKPKQARSQIKPALRALAAVNEREILAVLDDGRLVSFDPASGAELAKPAELAEEIGKAAIGESGRLVVAATVATGEVSAFSCAKEGKIEPRFACERAPVAEGYADAIAISEKSGLAAIGLEQGGLILAKLGRTSPEVQKIDLPSSARIGSIAFDPSGVGLAVGTMAGEVFIRDLQGNQIALPQQTANVTALAFDASSSRLASACDGFAVCIWKLPQALGAGGEAELLVKLQGHTNTVRALRFGPGADAIVSTSVDESVKAWTIAGVDRVSFGLPAPGRPALTDLDMSFDRKWLAASDVTGGIALWDLKTLSPLRSLPPLRDAEIMSLRWHPSEPRLAQSDKQGWLAIRPAEEGPAPQELKIDENGNTVDVVRWLPEGKSVVAGLFGGEIKEWNTVTEPVAFAERHPDAVQGLAVEPRAGRLYSSDSLGNLWAWDIVSRKRVAEFPASGEAQDSISLTQDGETALTAGNGVHAFLYDLKQAKIAQGIEIGAQSEGAAFSPDDKFFAVVDIEGKLHLWLYPENEVYASVKVYPEALGGKDEGATHLSRLAWLPELQAIAISTSRGEVKLVSYDVTAWRRRGKTVFIYK